MTDRLVWKTVAAWVEEAEENAHRWQSRLGHIVCVVCGIVRRADGQNKLCRGPVKISLRLAAKRIGGG